MFDNVDDRERKVKMEEANNAEKKTNLTFLGRSCGKFLGADGCQVCAISKEEKLLLLLVGYKRTKMNHPPLHLHDLELGQSVKRIAFIPGWIQKWKIQDRVYELLQHGRLQQDVAFARTPPTLSRTSHCGAFDFQLNSLLIVIKDSVEALLFRRTISHNIFFIISQL